MDFNKVIMIGNLTRDPETRNIPSGAQVTTFTIAVNNRRGAGKEPETMFLKVETWDKTAEIASKYLLKGSTVLVEGRLKLEEYESKDGQKRRDPVIVARDITLGPKSNREGGAPSGGGYGGGGGGYNDAPPRQAPARQAPQYNQPAPQDYGSSGPSQTEDDLPF